nr:unnamed protein product [Callosobruchus chinensis]
MAAPDDDDSQEGGSGAGGGSRAQYVSANCVVFTHYQGDAASVVDEHFSRALDKTTTHAKGKHYLQVIWQLVCRPKSS